MVLGIEAASVAALAAAAGVIVTAIARAVRMAWDARDRRERTAGGGHGNVQTFALTDTRDEVRTFLGVVRRGSRGRAVDAVQARLRERGWPVAVDGVFGPRTEHVVREFQVEKGLPADGIVGPDTWSALWTATIT